MLVIEFKVKMECKFSCKFVKMQEIVLLVLLVQMEEVSVLLVLLIKFLLNVCMVLYFVEFVSELVDFIKGVGLLQNLVVYVLSGDCYGVVVGGC